MAVDDAHGALAIWHDVRAGQEATFEDWYKNEHFPERLAVPGFQLGRRYEAVSGAPRYFCVYLGDTPATFVSPAYIERLENPTPLTRSIMLDAFLNMNRTVCRRVRRFGTLWGAFSVTARFSAPVEEAAMVSVLDPLSRADGVARCELWSSADPGSASAAEEKLRGRDAKIAACVVVETLRQSDAERVRGELTREFGGAAEIGIYRLLCELSSRAGAA
jgi:hypothetical protein